MYTYNKDDKSYTFSSDDLDIENLIELADNNGPDEAEEENVPEKREAEANLWH